MLLRVGYEWAYFGQLGVQTGIDAELEAASCCPAAACARLVEDFFWYAAVACEDS